MTTKNIWYAGFGPYSYDDTSTYPDGKYREGARLPQVYLDEDPTEDYHAATKSYADGLVYGLDSKISSLSLLTSSALSVATQESKAVSLASISDSKITSMSVVVSSNLVSDNSKATSQSTLLSSTNSIVGSANTVVSNINSRCTSHGI